MRSCTICTKVGIASCTMKISLMTIYSTWTSTIACYSSSINIMSKYIHWILTIAIANERPSSLLCTWMIQAIIIITNRTMLKSSLYMNLLLTTIACHTSSIIVIVECMAYMAIVTNCCGLWGVNCFCHCAIQTIVIITNEAMFETQFTRNLHTATIACHTSSIGVMVYFLTWMSVITESGKTKHFLYFKIYLYITFILIF